MFIHLHTSGVERLVSILLLQHGHHSAGVQDPPVQEEGGMRGGLMHSPCDPFGFGVKCVTPWLGLPEEMDHLGIATISEMSYIAND